MVAGALRRRRLIEWIGVAAGILWAGPLLGAPRFVSPSAGESLAPGAIVEVRWTSLCRPRTGVDEAEIVLSLDGGVTFPIRASNELSACETRFLWRVPSLPAGRARLALRAGSEGRDETERLVAVSGEFQILAEMDGRVQQLLRRVAEWWTPPEPSPRSAADLLEEAMSAPRDRLAPPETDSVADAPNAPPLHRPAEATSQRIPIRVATARILPAPGAGYSGAPLPLRL